MQDVSNGFRIAVLKSISFNNRKQRMERTEIKVLQQRTCYSMGLQREGLNH